MIIHSYKELLSVVDSDRSIIAKDEDVIIEYTPKKRTLNHVVCKRLFFKTDTKDNVGYYKQCDNDWYLTK